MQLVVAGESWKRTSDPETASQWDRTGPVDVVPSTRLLIISMKYFTGNNQASTYMRFE